MEGFYIPNHHGNSVCPLYIHFTKTLVQYQVLYFVFRRTIFHVIFFHFRFKNEMSSLSFDDDQENDPTMHDPCCDGQHPVVVSYDDVVLARDKIKEGVVRTPCTVSKAKTSNVDSGQKVISYIV